MIASSAAASMLPVNWAGFKCIHGQLTQLDMVSSGMLTRSNILHGAFGGNNSLVLALDVKPLQKHYSNAGGGGEGSGSEGTGEGDALKDLEFVGDKEWFRKEVAGGVKVCYVHDFFPPEKWLALKNEIFALNEEQGLFYLEYVRGAYSTGYSWAIAEGKLVQFEAINEFLDKLSTEYEIVGGFLSVNASGTHGLHQDTFTRDATHRFILTLGAVDKRMIFAEDRNGVSKDAMSTALKNHLY